MYEERGVKRVSETICWLNVVQLEGTEGETNWAVKCAQCVPIGPQSANMTLGKSARAETASAIVWRGDKHRAASSLGCLPWAILIEPILSPTEWLCSSRWVLGLATLAKWDKCVSRVMWTGSVMHWIDIIREAFPRLVRNVSQWD